ncbi:hypothetical protein CIB48_g7381 [Xylaria polymorpha]|nr:hypothetical protein CIB48_g7381 [Xylaria polymorpha]
MASNTKDNGRDHNAGQIDKSAAEPDALTIIKGDNNVKPIRRAPPGSNKQAIVGLQVFWDQEATPSGYGKIPDDLNAGMSRYTQPTTLTRLRPNYDYIKINRDLNAGAGGQYYVYIAYKTKASGK